MRTGNFIVVSGTTAVDENNNVVGKNNIYLQTDFIFRKIEKALKQAGAELKDVIGTRMFVTHISKSDEVLKVHNKYFNKIRPAATLVEISKIINSELLIEIEVDAIIGE